MTVSPALPTHVVATACPVEVLVPQAWYFNACKKALQGEAKRKYFEHAGALLTADGTDDDLIKFEGVPAGYKVVL